MPSFSLASSSGYPNTDGTLYVSDAELPKDPRMDLNITATRATASTTATTVRTVRVPFFRCGFRSS